MSANDQHDTCMNCGYSLHTLDDTATCPECGKPVAESRLSIAQDSDPRSTTSPAMRRFRDLLILTHVALAGVVVYAMIEPAPGGSVFSILQFVAGVVVLFVVAISYSVSLAIAGLAYRRGMPMWCVYLAGFVVGPVATVGFLQLRPLL